MLQITKKVSLQKYNTFALPSTAEYFCSVSSQAELSEALAWGKKHKQSIIILGAGSNVLLVGDLAGLVVHISILGIELTSQKEDDLVIKVGAGENWHQLVLKTLEMGWNGLENLSLIPGCVGAAPIQNIGAYGVELSERFDSLEVTHKATGDVRRMDLSDCQFGYRDSFFKQSGQDEYIITAVSFRLSVKPDICIEYPALKQALMKLHTQLQMKHGQSFHEILTPKMISDIVSSIRRSKLPDPAIIPNAGSFFKNPVISLEAETALKKEYPDITSYDLYNGNMKIAAGYLIEKAGWKGFQRNGVGVHDQQALVLVNLGGSGYELLSLASDIQASVLEKFGIALEIEPRVYQ
jgi:UDP-N-acetylmuramate dehydrogenase|tara:strand:- start:2981 stop:4033 length:1053 start_codon:yes stop_codon:yes gene_type:complete